MCTLVARSSLQHDLHLSASGIRAGMDPHSGAPFSRACLNLAHRRGRFSTCLVSHSCLMPKHACMSFGLWAYHSTGAQLAHTIPVSMQTQPMSRAGRSLQPASPYPLSLRSASRQQRDMVKGRVSRHTQRRTSSGQFYLQTQMRTSLLLHSPYKGIAAVHSSRLALQAGLQTRGRCQMARMQHQINCTRAWRMRPGATLRRCMQQLLIQ